MADLNQADEPNIYGPSSNSVFYTSQLALETIGVDEFAIEKQFKHFFYCFVNCFIVIASKLHPSTNYFLLFLKEK